LEDNPDLWFRNTSFDLLQDVLKSVGPLVNADPQDLVFVPNATTAINSIFQSLQRQLKSKDSVLMLDLTYQAIKHTIFDTCDKTGAKVIELTIPLPIKSKEDIIALVEKTLNENNSIRVALFDHITSSIGVILPVKELSALCRKRNIISIIDAAHAIGQVEIDLKEINPDFYTSNFHKWAFGPKGSAFMFVNKNNQNWIHPVVTSHEWKSSDFRKRFWMQGTREETMFAAAGAGLKFLQAIGIERSHQYRKYLIKYALSLFTQKWNSAEVICPEEMRGYMCLVKLPIPEDEKEKKLASESKVFACPHGSVRANWLMKRLLIPYHIVFPTTSYGGFIYGRFSAQIYNSEGEYKILVDVLDKICCEKEWEKL